MQSLFTKPGFSYRYHFRPDSYSARFVLVWHRRDYSLHQLQYLRDSHEALNRCMTEVAGNSSQLCKIKTNLIYWTYLITIVNIVIFLNDFIWFIFIPTKIILSQNINIYNLSTYNSSISSRTIKTLWLNQIKHLRKNNYH